MRDNKTSQAAEEYDQNITKTIPFYGVFHAETLDFIGEALEQPKSWLDAGCGTGNLILKAAEKFGLVGFVAADPAAGMLEIAKEKLAGLNVEYVLCGSEELDYHYQYDVVTAILSHHYLSAADRKQATLNCFNALKPGGVYITFETIKPLTETGLLIGLRRWRAAQMMNGKSAEAADKHLSRYGIELLPITIYEHIELLKETGFSEFDVLWASGLQAGFYAVK